MVKRIHEIRDPICNFIHVDINEREILDSDYTAHQLNFRLLF